MKELSLRVGGAEDHFGFICNSYCIVGEDHFGFSCNSCCIVNCMKTEIAQRTNKTDINHVPCLINRNVSFFHPLYSLFHFVRPTCLVQARTGLLQAVLSGLTGHMINGSFNTIQ